MCLLLPRGLATSHLVPLQFPHVFLQSNTSSAYFDLVDHSSSRACGPSSAPGGGHLGGIGLDAARAACRGLVFSRGLATQLVIGLTLYFRARPSGQFFAGGTVGLESHDCGVLRRDASVDDVYRRGLRAGRLFRVEAGCSDDRRKYQVAASVLHGRLGRSALGSPPGRG